MVDPAQWNKEIATEMAKEDGIELTDKHFEVLEFLRNANAKGETLTIRRVGKSGIVDIKGLYQLFPGGPLKLSSKFAGIPKPASFV
jgi:TusE/DsrC/DsvC family sulfur relay protein